MNELSISPLKLETYQLWPDGTISVEPALVIDFVFKLIANGHGLDKLYVTSITPEIEAYNKVSDHPLTVKKDLKYKLPQKLWELPDHYKYLNLDEHLLQLADRIEQDDRFEERVERLSTEIWMFKELNLGEVLRTLIYVIDVMTENNVVWGVGRGSSCSSYLLYLLGLHEVDPVKYDIEITDFLTTP